MLEELIPEAEAVASVPSRLLPIGLAAAAALGVVAWLMHAGYGLCESRDNRASLKGVQNNEKIESAVAAVPHSALDLRLAPWVRKH